MMTEQLAPASLPPGQRAYAIGDIHGCSDQLDELYRLIARDIAARPGLAVTVIHLGDYLDRGPDSAGVLDRLLRPFPMLPSGGLPAPVVVNLMGNHEALFLAAYDGEAAALDVWMNNGGSPTLASWGVPPRTRPRDWPKTIPAAHVALLRALRLSHAMGGYFFVHAGIRPETGLTEQSSQDMLWIRKPFLTWDGPLPAVVVHGHTPEDDPVVKSNRIGIDTGAVMGGALTCVVLEADRLRFLAA